LLSFCIGGLLLPCALPTASAEEPPLSFEYSQRVVDGENAWFSVTSRETLSDIKVTVTRLDGKKKKHNFSADSLIKGNSVLFEWEQKSGRIRYHVDIEGSNQNGTWKGNTEIEIEALDMLSLDIDLASVDLVNGKMSFSTNRGIVKAVLEIEGKDRVIIANKTQEYDGKQSTNVIEWGESSETPVLMSLEVHDIYGMWRSTKIFRLEIPHTDVVFDTADSSIRDDQEGHLQETLEPLLEALRKYDDLAAELYIAGYTDTVGSRSSNLSLSEKRAKSIATWFSKNGVSVPIYYQGFGEDVLAVPTADEVDEEQNRRAIYLLTNTRPQSADFPQTNWKRIH
jgi:outer membrane protein OmpA-like peptidoglycan-associated protein